MRIGKKLAIVGIIMIIIGIIGLIVIYSHYTTSAPPSVSNYGYEKTYHSQTFNITVTGFVNSSSSFYVNGFTRYVLLFNGTPIIRVIYGVIINVSAVSVKPNVSLTITAYFQSQKGDILLSTKTVELTMSSAGGLLRAYSVVELVNMHRDAFVSLVYGGYDESWNNTDGCFYCTIDVLATGDISGEPIVFTVSPMGEVNIHVMWKKESIWFGFFLSLDGWKVACMCLVFLGVVMVIEGGIIGKKESELFVYL